MAHLPAVPVFGRRLSFFFHLFITLHRALRLFQKLALCAVFPIPVATRFVTFQIIQTAIFPQNSALCRQKVFLFVFNIQQRVFHRACVKLFIFRLSTIFKQSGLAFPQSTNPVFKRLRAVFPQFSHPLLLRLPETMLFEDRNHFSIARKEHLHEHCLRQSPSVQCH